MDPQERARKIIETIWFWLPARWTSGGSWFEVRGFSITGDDESGGVDVMVSKNDANPEAVAFTNDELYGESVLDPNSARTRVEAM